MAVFCSLSRSSLSLDRSGWWSLPRSGRLAAVTDSLRALEPELDAVPGTVSIWCGPTGGSPAFTRNAQAAHYAASTMKVAVMAAAYRQAEAGDLDLDADVTVHDDFTSAAGSQRFRCSADYDGDPEPWRRLGEAVSLRWLIRRMIVRSSNLATNLVLEQTGVQAADDVWRAVGARESVVGRGIEDYAARDAGLDNLVTASDLATLLDALQAGRLAGPGATREMLEVLLAQEVKVDVVRGLPPGTRVAHKNGWVDGIRHSAALVFPDDAPAFVLATCITATMSDQTGCDLVADVAAAAWADRHLLASRAAPPAG